VRLELHGTGVHAVTVHPGGVRTPITRSGRVRAELLGRDSESFHRDVQTVARTSPEDAARVIHQGVTHGQARVVVGLDARAAYALAHIMPTRWFELVRPALRIAPRVLALIRHSEASEAR
jgi:short-subunit dehydrogenase